MNNSTSGHFSRAKDPAIVQEAQKPIEWISRALNSIAIILVLLGLVFWLRGCQSKILETPAAAERPNLNQDGTNALILMSECYTPCSADIQWKARIHTMGEPIEIKFPGIQEWFDHPAEGDAQAPRGVETGETFFRSANPSKEHIRVQVYKRITVQGGR